MIPTETISEIRGRSDIVKIVSRHVELRKKGQNHFGLCPFHSEKTPSFSVHAGKQIFHCFGCNETGDVFDFLARVEGRPFVEVARALAADAGIAIPEIHRTPEDVRREQERRSERERALELNDRVACFYRERLLGREGAAAREYLAKRGISDGTADRFRLGFAPDGWDNLLGHLTAEKVPTTLAERLGLVVPRREGGGHYDRFRARVIFPLLGPAGEALGFGGRVLADREDEPKYINTPETPVYRKGEALYGLHAARRAIQQSGVAMVVEGNFDVLALHEAGIDTAVAPMGTALTEKQVVLLKRFARQAVAMFDGDVAGRAAARKSVPLFLGADLDAKVALLPEGEDPDSFVRAQGREALEKRIRAALPAVDHELMESLSRMERTIPGRVRALEQIAAVLARVQNDTVRDLYAAKVAGTLDIDVARVRGAIRGAAASKAPGAAPAFAPNAVAPGAGPIPSELKRLLGLVADHPSLAPRLCAEGALGLVSHDGLRHVLARLCERQARGAIDWAQTLRDLVAEAPDPIREEVRRTLLAGEFAEKEECEDPVRALDECLAKLRGDRLLREVADLRQEAREAAGRGEEDEARALTLKAMDVDRRRRQLREVSHGR